MPNRPFARSAGRAVAGVLLPLLEQGSALPGTLATRVYRAIRAAILDGTLREGERLPSTRTLAADLAVSRSTAEAAYAQLEDEGYVRRGVGSGSYVGSAPVARTGDGSAARLPPPSAPSPRFSERGRAVALAGACIDARAIRAFSAGMPALDAFPAQTWQRLLARQARRDPASWMMYSDPQGLPSLREAIAQYLALSRGVHCDASQVIVLGSSQQALGLIAMMMLDAGDPVWLEEPGYRGAQTAFAAAGATLVPVPVDADGFCVEQGLRLAPQAKLAYVTPSHQYPLGMTLSLARRLQLLAWARDNGAWIVEDDYDSEFHYDSRPVSAIQGLDRQQRVLYVGTFSKVLYPGLRLAYLVVPKPMVAAFVTARTQVDGHAPALMQAALADFMQDGHFMAHVRRMRELYRARRDILMEELQRHLGDRLLPQASQGGMQAACLLADQRTADTRIADEAAAAGIDLPPLSRLYLGAKQRNGFVMGFSALAPSDIRAGARSLARLWQRSTR
ncbi:MAG TPA: PLP-dependent aminotransferase family protein [Noviherbaspirillum sp.]|uniref:MocR-like pyridoxine biosynthesis transcription factor PdxR n=1 Tax=Noviherbaspirillum sp. TaxID=1926288 RepID=UPI002D73C85F|nr:PLP-dependent aminotransferase family protein [Noviherbaspirillum sp.]HYD93732.1 PLP-dependent aminotransferase family protein [Noviherbaspirillum sp.]